MHALLVIDAQQEYAPTGNLPVVNFDATVQNIAQLIAAARENNTEVTHIRHISSKPHESCHESQILHCELR
jgi:nicotinamidase-related amidase